MDRRLLLSRALSGRPVALPHRGSEKEKTSMGRIRNSIFALCLVGTLAVPAMAFANEGPPPHGHMLVMEVEFGPTGVTYKKCVDLANNQVLPFNAHHEHLHTGMAGEALRDNAGHFAVPTAPFSPFRDCAHLAEVLGPPTK
jgi:hypothetical protein